MTHELQRAWGEFQPNGGINVLAGDEVLLEDKIKERYVALQSWDSLIDHADFGARDERLHLSLLPQPFFGDLQRARVFVLALNPGLHPLDYFGEQFVPGYREACLNTLRQRVDARFPMMWLDPRFSWHSGFSYWHGRLASLIGECAHDLQLSSSETLSYLASSIAVLELLPYHSASFGLPSWIMGKLRSVEVARTFVSDVLVPRADAGDVLIVATRHGSDWSLPEHHPNVIVYDSAHARAASLGPKSDGGAAILRRLRAQGRASS